MTEHEKAHQAYLYYLTQEQNIMKKKRILHFVHTNLKSLDFSSFNAKKVHDYFRSITKADDSNLVTKADLGYYDKRGLKIITESI